MEKIATLSTVIGAVLVTTAVDASAGNLTSPPVSTPTADKTSSQLLGSTSKLNAGDLVRQYGLPAQVKAMPEGRQQMNWSLANGELQVTVESATGKVLNAKMIAANSSVDTMLATLIK